MAQESTRTGRAVGLVAQILLWHCYLAAIAVILGAVMFVTSFPPKNRRVVQAPAPPQTQTSTQQSEFQEWQARKRRKLAVEVERTLRDPCYSEIEFVKIPPHDWQMTCPGCLIAPASRMFPSDFLARLDVFAKDGKIAFLELLIREGTCP